jgi:hypothetical protein
VFSQLWTDDCPGYRSLVYFSFRLPYLRLLYCFDLTTSQELADSRACGSFLTPSSDCRSAKALVQLPIGRLGFHSKFCRRIIIVCCRLVCGTCYSPAWTTLRGSTVLRIFEPLAESLHHHLQAARAVSVPLACSTNVCFRDRFVARREMGLRKKTAVL